MQSIKLYLHLLWLDFHARSQYRADFLLGIGASVLQHSVTLGTLWLIFRNVHALGGWNGAQAAVLYGLFSIMMGLVNLLASGLRNLPNLVEAGELDGILVLPAHPFVQLLPMFNPGALGDVLLGVAILVVGSGAAGVQWTIASGLLCFVAILCGVGVLLGLLTAIYALAFWVRQPGLSHGMEEVTQLAHYPAGIYPRWLQIVITWVLPVSFASFYPAAYLTGAQPVASWVALAAVPLAAGALGAGYWSWTVGLRKYEGTGS